ncbi:MAG: Fic family protein [Gammaproteobacteria bacterium]
MQGMPAVDNKGRYLHWDKLRHLTPPDGMTSEQWWTGIKAARKNVSKSLSFCDKHGQSVQFAVTDQILAELHWLDRNASGSLQSDEAITNPQSRDTYLVRSLIEEAINSSQLEGASTTHDVAKEMIRQDRDPKDISERMIINNYRAMQFIRDIKDEDLTPSIVFELHRILTEHTMEDPEKSGQFRDKYDDIHVIDDRSQEYLHTPPEASELPDRLLKLCEFANANNNAQTGDTFLHPVIKAIILHFMLAYDHPFYDGNGRTARALFYWAMAKQGYWLVEFISISEIIKKAPAQYGKAFLYTETDENDLTYFLIHQLDVIHKAIESLHQFLDTKIKAVSEAEEWLNRNDRLRGKLNFRQLALLRHALKHPRFSYVIEEHQMSHALSYDVARKDLIKMSDELNLLVKTKQGKRYFFMVPDDLAERIGKR